MRIARSQFLCSFMSSLQKPYPKQNVKNFNLSLSIIQSKVSSHISNLNLKQYHDHFTVKSASKNVLSFVTKLSNILFHYSTFNSDQIMASNIRAVHQTIKDHWKGRPNSTTYICTETRQTTHFHQICNSLTQS